MNKTTNDFTGLTEAELDLYHQCEAIFMHANEGIIITNIEGRIIRCNKSAETLFGYEPEELNGQAIDVLIPASVRPRHEHYRQQFNAQPTPRSMGHGRDLFGLKKDGTQFSVEVSLSPFESSIGKYIVAFVIDITVRKRAEQEIKNYNFRLEQEVEERTLLLKETINRLEQTKSELDDSLARERELNTLKSRFVTTASHEFRTPLTTVLSSLSLIRKYAELGQVEKQARHIQKIQESVHFLTDILNDFLSLDRLEEGKVVVSPEQFNFEEFATELIHDLRGMAKMGQTITYDHSGNPYFISDQKAMRHVLINLISNALKFSPEGKPVEVRSRVLDEQLVIQVKDYGVGIPKEDQKNLFERFFRATNTSHIQGTGLGLNIAWQYVGLLKGSISFDSVLNEGTEFFIEIPLPIQS